MIKCGFCHKSGHNRRSCDEIKKLGAKGIVVGDDQVVEDFPDRSDDSDYSPNGEEEEEEFEEKEENAQFRIEADTPPVDITRAPSDNSLNQPADPSRLSPSPIM